MRGKVLIALSWLLLAAMGGGCMPADPAPYFIEKMDRAPESERPPNWSEVRRLMMRPAPSVGDDAPDFTLSTADGSQRITRSAFHEGRPLVLIFGSFT